MRAHRPGPGPWNCFMSGSTRPRVTLLYVRVPSENRKGVRIRARTLHTDCILFHRGFVLSCSLTWHGAHTPCCFFQLGMTRICRKLEFVLRSGLLGMLFVMKRSHACESERERRKNKTNFKNPREKCMLGCASKVGIYVGIPRFYSARYIRRAPIKQNRPLSQ